MSLVQVVAIKENQGVGLEVSIWSVQALQRHKHGLANVVILCDTPSFLMMSLERFEFIDDKNHSLT